MSTFQPRDPAYAQLERRVLRTGEDFLFGRGWTYLSIPSLVKRSTIERQAAVTWEHTFKINDSLALAGSAEQGILELFEGTRLNESEPQHRYFANNSCFRNEDTLDGWKSLLEFRKIEQFVFATSDDAARYSFDECLANTTKVFGLLGVHVGQLRYVDTTNDPGYHIKKTDIEVMTQAYGWMEVCSCTYFGVEQAERFNITGAPYTVSCTLVATPRALIPLLEHMRMPFPCGKQRHGKDY